MRALKFIFNNFRAYANNFFIVLFTDQKQQKYLSLQKTIHYLNNLKNRMATWLAWLFSTWRSEGRHSVDAAMKTALL